MIGKFPASYIDLCLYRLLEHPWKEKRRKALIPGTNFTTPQLQDGILSWAYSTPLDSSEIDSDSTANALSNSLNKR